jgi:hypothetical protein
MLGFLFMHPAFLNAPGLESNVNEVLLDYLPDRGEQTGHIFAVRPGAASRVENSL